MHKLLLKKVNKEDPKDGKVEDYTEFLQAKQLEFDLHITKELQKALKRKRDLRLMKKKCVEVLQTFFDKQLDLLVGKRAQFDFEVAVKAIRKEAPFYGAEREHEKVVKEHKWPYFEAYRSPGLTPEEQESIVRDLKVTKIEWAASERIKCIRFTFNNGQTTPHIGQRVDQLQAFEIPNKAEIGTIIIGVRDKAMIDYLAFYDLNGKELCKISDKQPTGKQYKLDLDEDEHIIGVNCTQCDRFVRGIGFYIYRPGIGIPKLE